MTFDKRTFLNWDEAAEFLGLDREGLRQALLYRWSPWKSEDAEKEWLPVALSMPRKEFMATLEYDNWQRQAEFSWNGRDSFYLNCEGKADLTFSDGSSLPLRGRCQGGHWTASHGYGSGWGHAFEVGGDRLVISPESVANACAEDGHIGALAIAPAGWCDDGFPDDMHFVVVSCDNTFYSEQPRDLFENALFFLPDLERIRHADSRGQSVPTQAAPPEKPVKLRADREENLLRVIAGLWALSDLPAEHNTTADKLSALFDTWGWDKPAKPTMADTILKVAAKLPGACIRSSD